MRWTSLLHHMFLPWWIAPSQAQSNGFKQPWNETSDTVSPNTPFCLITWLSLVFCFSGRKLTNDAVGVWWGVSSLKRFCASQPFPQIQSHQQDNRQSRVSEEEAIVPRVHWLHPGPRNRKESSLSCLIIPSCAKTHVKIWPFRNKDQACVPTNRLYLKTLKIWKIAFDAKRRNTLTRKIISESNELPYGKKPQIKLST
jgi:hypothetical protein